MSRVSPFVLTIYLGLGLAGSSKPAGPIQKQDEKLAQEIDRLIGVFADPEARGELIEQSQQAIARLTVIGKPAVPKLLDAILSKNDTVAAYSANTLDNIGPAAVDLVRAKWPALTEAEKWKIMRFRAKFDYEASLEFALDSLDSKEPTVRRQAIEYAGKYKETKARRKLHKLLNTEVPELHRWSVIEGLAKIGNDDEVADTLIALLTPESWVAKGLGLPLPQGELPPWWPDGREHVLDALGKMQARRAAPKLLEMLGEKEPSKGFYFNRQIVGLLGEWGYTESIPDLKRLLVSKHEWCSHEAVARALLQLKDRSGVPILMQHLRSLNRRDRVFACEAFAQLGDKWDVLALGGALRDADLEVQMLACEGLERITGVVNRAPGQTSRTSADTPLWLHWFEQNKEKYQTGK